MVNSMLLHTWTLYRITKSLHHYPHLGSYTMGHEQKNEFNNKQLKWVRSSVIREGLGEAFVLKGASWGDFGHLVRMPPVLCTDLGTPQVPTVRAVWCGHGKISLGAPAETAASAINKLDPLLRQGLHVEDAGESQTNQETATSLVFQHLQSATVITSKDGSGTRNILWQGGASMTGQRRHHPHTQRLGTQQALTIEIPGTQGGLTWNCILWLSWALGTITADYHE